MAAALHQESVTFTETSCENIGYAKEFWRAIDGNCDEKSRLFVSGVDHRLHTAAWSDRSKLEQRQSKNCTTSLYITGRIQQSGLDCVFK